jgi:hypothetical protein
LTSNAGLEGTCRGRKLPTKLKKRLLLAKDSLGDSHKKIYVHGILFLYEVEFFFSFGNWLEVYKNVSLKISALSTKKTIGNPLIFPLIVLTLAPGRRYNR